MPHDTSLLALLAGSLALAFVLGTIAHRLKLSPLVGYLLAGVLVGPFTPSFVGDSAMAAELAEIGVILLMFGVGLNFSLDDLREVRRIIQGSRAGRNVLSIVGRDARCGEQSCAHHSRTLPALRQRPRIQPARGRALRGRRQARLGTTVPLHHPAGDCQRAAQHKCSKRRIGACEHISAK